MLKKTKIGEATWIDLENPTKLEIDETEKAYNMDSSVSEDLLNPTLRHKIEFGEKHAYIVLHFPAFKDSSQDDAAYELDFVIGPNYVLTVHYEKLDSFYEWSSSLDNLKESSSINSRDLIFFGLLNIIITNFDLKLVEIDHWVRDIEKNMFAGKERKTILEISEATRHIIDFKKITAVYPETFESLKKEGTIKFGEDFGLMTDKLIENFTKTKLKLERLAETIHELRETNNSILTTKQNETMQVLTIVFITLSVILSVILIWLEVTPKG